MAAAALVEAYRLLKLNAAQNNNHYTQNQINRAHTLAAINVYPGRFAMGQRQHQTVLLVQVDTAKKYINGEIDDATAVRILMNGNVTATEKESSLASFMDNNRDVIVDAVLVLREAPDPLPFDADAYEIWGGLAAIGGAAWQVITNLIFGVDANLHQFAAHAEATIEIGHVANVMYQYNQLSDINKQRVLETVWLILRYNALQAIIGN